MILLILVTLYIFNVKRFSWLVLYCLIDQHISVAVSLTILKSSTEAQERLEWESVRSASSWRRFCYSSGVHLPHSYAVEKEGEERLGPLLWSVCRDRYAVTAEGSCM